MENVCLQDEVHHNTQGFSVMNTKVCVKRSSFLYRVYCGWVNTHTKRTDFVSEQVIWKKKKVDQSNFACIIMVNETEHLRKDWYREN